VTTEAVSPLPGPTFEQQRAWDKQTQVLTQNPQKKILEDWNKKKIEEEKRISSEGKPLTETQDRQTNAWKKKTKKQLYDELETVPQNCFACDDFGKEWELWYRRTGCEIWVHEDCSGWDSPDGCVTFASRWPIFPKIAYIN